MFYLGYQRMFFSQNVFIYRQGLFIRRLGRSKPRNTERLQDNWRILISSFCQVHKSTQENKYRIGQDFFPSCIIHTTGQKKLKILQLFIIWVADHRFKLEQKIGTDTQCAGSILFRSGPIRCLSSWVEIGLDTAARHAKIFAVSFPMDGVKTLYSVNKNE